MQFLGGFFCLKRGMIFVAVFFLFLLSFILFSVLSVLFDVELDCKMVFARSKHRRPVST